MRKYSLGLASAGRVEYGIEVVEGLRSFPETEALAPAFEAQNEELDAAHEARLALRKPMLKARSKLRVKGHETDRVLRQLGMAAKIADGGRPGPIFSELFPQGITPVVAPGGRRQLPPTIEVAERLERSRRTGVEPLRTEWLPRLRAAIEGLDGAVKAYDAAFGAVMAAFQTELMLREEHAIAVDKLMGEVRAAFPADRAAQNAIFPPPPPRSASPDDADEPSDPDPAGE